MRLAHLALVGLLAVLLFVAGCSSNKGKIEGTKWRSQAANIKGTPAPAGAMQLEFGKDGGLVFVAGPLRLTGKYSLGFGDNVTLKLDEELDGRKDHTEKVVIKGNTLTMTDSDGTAVTFDKAE